MRILIVEDEHRIASSLKKGFGQERYAVDIAYTGLDGYDLASTEDYDLIILDLLLPGMNGLTICKNLREKQIHTPILMLTAKGQISDKIVGLNAGADDYLAKPFSFEELIARVKALIRRPKTMLNTVLKVDELKLATTFIREGEEDFFEFTPEKEGTFEFYCSVGKHKQMGMKGILVVE